MPLHFWGWIVESEGIILYFIVLSSQMHLSTKARSKYALANNVLFCKCFYCNVNKLQLYNVKLVDRLKLTNLFYEIFW